MSATDIQGGRKRKSIEQRVMSLVGTDWCGNDNPPESRTLYYSTDGRGREVPRGTEDAYVICGNNDGFELWIGTPHEWYHHFSSAEVKMLLRYLVVDWYIKSRWLGLRRPVYYWALRRHVDRFRKTAGRA